MTALRSAETIESHGCLVDLRSVEGTEANELFLHCRPPDNQAKASAQALAMYSAIHAVLHAAGATSTDIVAETVFLRDLARHIAPVREARAQVFEKAGLTAGLAAVTEIEQPPVNERACLEIMVHAIVLEGAPSHKEPVTVEPDCHCSECSSVHGIKMQLGSQASLQAGNLYGAGDNAYEQTGAMLALTERLLQSAGMAFSDVVRTWIRLRHMERDYADFNRARREFFQARGIDPIPASTAIGGCPVPPGHDLSLAIYALKGEDPLARTVMTSPTLNEAPEYGADFVRGMRVTEANKLSLLVSGTASVDEAGNTAHVGDFAAQADRMLLNLSTLLAGQDASFADVVAAISYVKHAADATCLRQKFQAAGFTGFPNVLVEAEVCRADLLCETELIAITPT